VTPWFKPGSVLDPDSNGQAKIISIKGKKEEILFLKRSVLGKELLSRPWMSF
jgi:hypothetical protein